MSYKDWLATHNKKHNAIIVKLKEQNFSQNEIIDYFSYENMQQKHTEFCPLYAKNKKCHDIKDLNCYLCGCPYFRVYDESKITAEAKIMSGCIINSKFGKLTNQKNNLRVHQDCSFCTLSHQKRFIHKVFDHNWSKIMSKVFN